MVMFGLMSRDEHEDWCKATGYHLSKVALKLLTSRSSGAYGSRY